MAGVSRPARADPPPELGAARDGMAGPVRAAQAGGHAAAGLRRSVPRTMGGVAGRLVIRDLALADGTSAHLQIGIAVVIDDGHSRWLGPTEESDAAGAEVLDGGGATLMPGMVDAHSHLSGPGGSHWIERFSDPPETLRQVGGVNAPP